MQLAGLDALSYNMCHCFPCYNISDDVTLHAFLSEWGDAMDGGGTFRLLKVKRSCHLHLLNWSGDTPPEMGMTPHGLDVPWGSICFLCYIMPDIIPGSIPKWAATPPSFSVKWGCHLHLLRWDWNAASPFLNEMGMSPLLSQMKWRCHANILKWDGYATSWARWVIL